MIKTIPLLLLSALSCSSLAQGRVKLVALESGINFVDVQMRENDRIRASASEYNNYGDDFFYGRSRGTLNRAYGGVKVEVRSASNAVGFATGIRFSQVSNSLSKESSPGYFYYFLKQTETTTEYLRVSKITQRTSYLSIPLEVRVFPYRERKIRLYFLLGTEFGVKMRSKTDVRFHNPAMSQYEQELAEGIEEPGDVFGAFYGRSGLIIGKDKPFLDIGITAPFGMTSSAATLVKPGVGGGLHLQVIKTF